jgi:hypothetical protein
MRIARQTCGPAVGVNARGRDLFHKIGDQNQRFFSGTAVRV